jgi:hypothetical protein
MSKRVHSELHKTPPDPRATKTRKTTAALATGVRARGQICQPGDNSEDQVLYQGPGRKRKHPVVVVGRKPNGNYDIAEKRGRWTIDNVHPQYLTFPSSAAQNISTEEVADVVPVEEEEEPPIGPAEEVADAVPVRGEKEPPVDEMAPPEEVAPAEEVAPTKEVSDAVQDEEEPLVAPVEAAADVDIGVEPPTSDSVERPAPAAAGDGVDAPAAGVKSPAPTGAPTAAVEPPTGAPTAVEPPTGAGAGVEPPAGDGVDAPTSTGAGVDAPAGAPTRAPATAHQEHNLLIAHGTMHLNNNECSICCGRCDVFCVDETAGF